VEEIYVEAPEPEADNDVGHESPSKVTAFTEMKEERERDIQLVRAWYSPSRVVKQHAVPEVSSHRSVAQAVGVQGTGHGNQFEGLPHEDSSGSNSDYLLGDEASSSEDEEAIEIVTKFKKFKTKLNVGEAANLDNVVLEILQTKSCDNLADLFTKSLPYSLFHKYVEGIGMRRFRDLQKYGGVHMKN
jgi:alpha-galactosidase